MKSEKSNEAITTGATKRINGMDKYLKNAKVEIPLQGNLVKPAAMRAIFQEALDTRAAVTAGQAVYQSAMKARDDAEVARLAADESLKAWVLFRYGVGSTEANEFGYAPRKAPEVSAQTRAQSVLLNKATRVARGTKGAKQRLKIKGVLPTPTVPAAPAVPALPTPVATVPAAPVVQAPVLVAPPVAAASTASPAPVVATAAGAPVAAPLAQEVTHP